MTAVEVTSRAFCCRQLDKKKSFSFSKLSLKALVRSPSLSESNYFCLIRYVPLLNILESKELLIFFFIFIFLTKIHIFT